jgi:heme-degrading monooxygenase HmoA
MYVTMWEFLVRPGSEDEFQRVYGPDGEWARLFASGAGYLGTELLLDGEQGDGSGAKRYVTIDRWSSAEALADFRLEFGAEYEQIDARCESLTMRETHLGSFENQNPVGTQEPWTSN